MAKEKKVYSKRVSYEEAKPHIEAVISEGKEDPSAIDIHERIGHGSYATYQKYLERYFAEKKTEEPPKKITMTPEIEEFYAKMVGRLIDEAVRSSVEELAQTKTEKQRLIEESEKFEDDLIDMSQALEKAETSFSEQSHTIMQLERERDALDLSVKTAKTESDELNQRLGKLQLLLEGYPDLEKEVKDLRLENKRLLQEKAEAEQKQTIAEARVQELTGYREEAAQMRPQLMEALKLKGEAEIAAATLKVELDSALRRMNDLIPYKAKHDAITTAIAELKDRHLQETNALRKDMQSLIDKGSQEVERLRGALETAKDERIQLLLSRSESSDSNGQALTDEADDTKAKPAEPNPTKKGPR